MTDPIPGPQKKRPWRAIAYTLILAVFAAGMAAVYYHEELGHFIRLRGWDPGGPGRAVVQFLVAGKNGDEARAAKFIESEFYRPISENGKLTGYRMQGRGESRDFPFATIAPEGRIQPKENQILYDGGGYARVGVPMRSGELLYYRVEMKDGAWKITWMD